MFNVSNGREALTASGTTPMICDGRTVPPVARDGSIDRLCRPDLDPLSLCSPSPLAVAASLPSPTSPQGGGRDITFLQTTLNRAGCVRGTVRWPCRSRSWPPPRELGSKASRVRAAHALAQHAAFGYSAVRPRLEGRGGIPVTVASPNARAARSWQAGKAGSPNGDLGALGGSATGKALGHSVGR